jgi:hypothetical protein
VRASRNRLCRSGTPIGAEPVKHFETRSYDALCVTSSLGSLIHATVGSFGGDLAVLRLEGATTGRGGWSSN